MTGIKSLAKDTAIYGMSSIIGRFLNWCLVPLYTYKLATGGFGDVTNLYAWMALLLVILIYGLETGFFRFANDGTEEDPKTVYSTCLFSLAMMIPLFQVQKAASSGFYTIRSLYKIVRRKTKFYVTGNMVFPFIQRLLPAGSGSPAYWVSS